MPSETGALVSSCQPRDLLTGNLINIAKNLHELHPWLYVCVYVYVSDRRVYWPIGFFQTAESIHLRYNIVGEQSDGGSDRHQESAAGSSQASKLGYTKIITYNGSLL